MDDTKAHEIARQFADAASRGLDAGFDGIEVLAGNGHLFDQFQNSMVNTRTGPYGGSSAKGRTSLLLETLKAMRDRVGPNTLLGVRLSPYGRFNAIPEDPCTEETHL
jgi:N-ethylmaleimide reductase